MPPIFLINLERSPQRLANSVMQFNKHELSFTKINAIDGATLSQAQINKHYCETLNKKNYHYPLSRGQIGCYLSHRKAWQAIVDQKLDYALIFEDDFSLTSDIHAAINRINNLEMQWQLIKLCAYKGRKRRIAYQKTLDDGYSLVVHKKLMSGCCATAISYQGAKQLLAATEKFGRPIDCDLQHIWETGVCGYSLMPFPVIQSTEQESDIHVRSEKQVKKAFFKRKYQQLIANINNKKATSEFINEIHQEHFKQKRSLSSFLFEKPS